MQETAQPKPKTYPLPSETQEWLIETLRKNPAINIAEKACKRHNKEALLLKNNLEQTFLICGSSLFKTLLNDRLNADKMYGISDIDIIYFDPDTSYEAEDRIIKSVLSNIENDRQNMFDIKNQTRVHLWKPQKYGEPCKPYQYAEEPLEKASTHLQMASLKVVNQSTDIEIYSPFWYYDIMHWFVRHNRNTEHSIDRITEKVNAWQKLYPRLVEITE